MQFLYYSDGVVLPNEPADIFANNDKQLMFKRLAGVISIEEEQKLKYEFELNRHRPEHIALNNFQGDFFNRDVSGGFRQFSLRSRERTSRAENNYLMLLGTLLAFAGLFGFIV